MGLPAVFRTSCFELCWFSSYNDVLDAVKIVSVKLIMVVVVVVVAVWLSWLCYMCVHGLKSNYCFLMATNFSPLLLSVNID